MVNNFLKHDFLSSFHTESLYSQALFGFVWVQNPKLTNNYAGIQVWLRATGNCLPAAPCSALRSRTARCKCATWAPSWATLSSSSTASCTSRTWRWFVWSGRCCSMSNSSAPFASAARVSSPSSRSASPLAGDIAPEFHVSHFFISQKLSSNKNRN